MCVVSGLNRVVASSFVGGFEVMVLFAVGVGLLDRL